MGPCGLRCCCTLGRIVLVTVEMDFRTLILGWDDGASREKH